MELIRITDSRMKIMMTDDDMKDYALSADGIRAEDSRSRRAFREILETVRDESGFDAVHERVYVQFFPGRSGGCELFLTKLGRIECQSAWLGCGGGPAPAYYRFPSLPNLLGACRSIADHAYSGESVAYRTECGDYYLKLDTETPEPFEFNGSLCRENMTVYLAEHSEWTCGGAITKLGVFA